VHQFADLDWHWLVPRVKLRDEQNRLGVVASLARELAERNNDHAPADQLEGVERRLEKSRLMAEDSLGVNPTKAERDWLRKHRSAGAKFWNVLTDLKVEHLDDRL